MEESHSPSPYFCCHQCKIYREQQNTERQLSLWRQELIHKLVFEGLRKDKTILELQAEIQRLIKSKEPKVLIEFYESKLLSLQRTIERLSTNQETGRLSLDQLAVQENEPQSSELLNEEDLEKTSDLLLQTPSPLERPITPPQSIVDLLLDLHKDPPTGSSIDTVLSTTIKSRIPLETTEGEIPPIFDLGEF